MTIQLEKRLASYIAAAAIAAPASAAIINPIDAPVINGHSNFSIDGTTFSFSGSWSIDCLDISCSSFEQGGINGINVNNDGAIMLIPVGYLASIDPRQVGPSQRFQGGGAIMGEFLSTPSFLSRQGYCIGACTGNLGFEITVGSNTEYGLISFTLTEPPCAFDGVTAACFPGGEFNSYQIMSDPQPIPDPTAPEPGTLGLLALGFLGLAYRKHITSSVPTIRQL